MHAAVIALAMVLTLALSQDARFLRASINADILWQTSLIWDVLHRADAWKTFQLSTNPNVFPDLALGFVLQVATGSWRWALVLSAFARLLAFAYAGGWLVRAIVPLALPLAALWVEALCGALMLASIALPATWQEGHLLYPALFPIATLFIADTHSGGLIAALGVVAAIVWSFRQEPRWWRTAIVFLISALAVVSDREVWLEFVLPVAFVATGMLAGALRRGNAQRYAHPLALSGSVVAGAIVASFVLQPLFNHAADLPTPTIATLLTKIPDAAGQTLVFAQANPNLVTGTAVLGAVFLACPFVLMRTRSAADDDAGAWWLWSFCALSLAGGLTFTTALFTDFDSYRYAEPALFGMIPIAVIVAYRIGRTPRLFPALATLVAVVAVAQIGRAGTLVPGIVSWQPDLAACVAELGARFDLHAGLAGFWTARPLTIASDETLQIDQVGADGSPKYYTNDVAWYTKSLADPTRPPQYRFVIMRELDERSVTHTFGRPDRIGVCSDTQIWIYTDPNRIGRVVNRTLR